MTRKFFFFLALALCATPLIGPPLALFAGLIFAQIWACPYPELSEKTVKKLLQVAIVGLGFGMNLHAAIESSLGGLALVVGSIFVTLLLGIYGGQASESGHHHHFTDFGGYRHFVVVVPSPR